MLFLQRFLFQILILNLLSISRTDSYKVIIFVPTFSNSQMIMIIRLADALAQAGHDIVLYRPEFNPSTKAFKSKYARDVFAPAADPAVYVDGLRMRSNTSFRELSLLGKEHRHMTAITLSLLKTSCNVQAANKPLLEQLRAEKFDLAISHMYDMCPLGLIHVLRVPTYIWMSTGVLLDNMAMLSGTPSPPSYVTSAFTAHGDEMTFRERLSNTLSTAFFNLITQNFYGLVDGPSETFRKHYGASFPDLLDVASKSPLLFVNSDILFDFPRPILHKTVYMAGLDVKQPKALPPDWQKLADEAEDGFVLMSFGTVVNVSSMPQHWRMALLDSFAKFPTYTFVWKFEADFPEAKRVPNVVVTSWMPQNDLFRHPKMKFFITHGGYNSLIETANAGVPTISIPLFGDQFRNMRMAQRNNLTLVIDKRDFSEASVTAAIREMLSEHNSYSTGARKLFDMMQEKRIKSEELVVKWVELLAKSKTLPLDIVGAKLNFATFFSLDVISSIVFGVVAILTVFSYD